MAGNLLDVNVALVICELICCMGSILVRKGMVSVVWNGGGLCGFAWGMIGNSTFGSLPGGQLGLGLSRLV